MKRFFFILILTLVLSITSCTVPSYLTVQRGIQTHFSYPNSVVTPIGNISKTSTELTSVLIIPLGSDDLALTDEAIDEAIRAKGGDLVINYYISCTETYYIFFTTKEITITGEVAKMDITDR